ncbi:baseplate J/gp47 family protein [Candidatus Uhrbacteria bacterium]|nr:baseplate J/gp47 family protein [Candidatus Uhrbacteria bacterium]
MYRKISFTFLALTLLAIAVILFFALSNATVVIKPTSHDFPLDFIVNVKSAGEDQLSFNDSDTTAKGRILAATKEETKEFPTSVISEGEPTKATGIVTLINSSGTPQALIVNTRLLSKEGVLFRLTKAVNVPAKGKVDVKVLADKAGKEGEIGPSEFTIPGLNAARQKDVTGKSDAAMTGGTKATRAFADSDLKKAEESFLNDLAKRTVAEWETSLPVDLKVLEKSVYKEILSVKSDAKAGDKVDKFNLTLKARIAGLAVAEKELLSLAASQLKKSVPDQDELIKLDESKLSYQTEKYDEPSQALSLKITVAGQTQLRSSSSAFDRSKLVGLTVVQAKKYLKGISGVSDVQINLSPFWLTRMPILKDHIRVMIEP